MEAVKVVHWLLLMATVEFTEGGGGTTVKQRAIVVS